MVKKAKKPREPTPPWKVVVLLIGLGLMLVGGIGLYVGFGKFGFLVPIFSGQPPPDNMGDQLDAAMSGSVFPLVVGFVGSMAGFIAVKVGMSPPKPKTVEQLVEEEVARRLGPKQAEESIPVNLLAATSEPRPRSVHAAPVASQMAAPAPAAHRAPASHAAPPSHSVPSPLTHEAMQAVAQSASAPRPANAVPGTHCKECGRPLLAGRFCRVCDLR